MITPDQIPRFALAVIFYIAESWSEEIMSESLIRASNAILVNVTEREKSVGSYQI